MDMLFTLLSFALLLLILVGVHEWGHYTVARLCGVKVLRFSIGLGKPFFKWHNAEGTEFALAPIPLGGYVKMLDASEAPVPKEWEPFAYNHKTPNQRIAILAAGPLANLILAIGVFALLGLQGIEKLSPHIGHVTPQSLAAKAGLEAGQEIVAVDDVATPSRDAVLERLILRLGETGPLTLRVKYPNDTDITYDITLELNLWLKGANQPDPFASLGFSFFSPAHTLRIAHVAPDGAAAAAGLQAGDLFERINNTPIASWEALVEQVQNAPSRALSFNLNRQGQPLEVTLTPKAVEENGKTIGRIGVAPTREPLPAHMLRRLQLPPLEALAYGFHRSWEVAEGVVVSLKKLIVGEISTKNLSGPIGIAKVAGGSAKAGLSYYTEFLAQLSVYLAIFNLLPIPLLDGGHILFNLIEAIKGSPPSEKFKHFSAQLGLLILALLMSIAFYNDLLNLWP